MVDPSQEEIATLIKAGSALIQVVSYERQRVYGFANRIGQELKYDVLRWSNVHGVERWNSENHTYDTVDADLTDPIAMLRYFRQDSTKGLFIVEDFHGYMNTQVSPEIIRHLREIALIPKMEKKVLLIVQPIKTIPAELIKEMPIVEVPLPTAEILGIILEDIVHEYKLSKEKFQISDKIIQAALGLTIMEARLAFSKIIVERKQIKESEISFIIHEKGNIIKKRGILEYIQPKEDMNNVGGLDVLKMWLERRRRAFDKKAEEFGLDKPKGVLLLGVPGCGKSLCAKAVANAWHFPLLRFDLGKVYSGIVGESEANIRNALDIAKALAPCVLWIDEIEKGLSGVQSSNQTDSGVSARVFGTFLTWMQEKEESVFVVATANDISQLPPELLRKGRFDEIFFVDLPTQIEREAIFNIHLKKNRRNPENFDVKKCASKAIDFTGAEIEQIVEEALFKAFDADDEKRDLTTEDIMDTIKTTTPLVVTMSEVIQNLRRWAITRAKFASSSSLELSSKEKPEYDSKTPHLKQEIRNPFI